MALDLRPHRPLRVAVLVKQIPVFEELALGPDGRLVRDGLELEMNAYCRRAVALATEVVAAGGGSVTFLTLGPPQAEDVLREAIAWARDRDVDATGVLVSDPAFAGSDTLATATALALALEHEAEVGGEWDLLLLGRSSVDADTGQVGPELAQLLGLPLAQGVRELTVDGPTWALRLEHDDEWVDVDLTLPAVLTTAERLLDPSKVPPDGRARVSAERIRRLRAADLGDGPWGEDASPTVVGETRVLEISRLRRRLDGPVADQVAAAVQLLADRGVLDPYAHPLEDEPVPTTGGGGAPVAVVVEPGRPGIARELLGGAAELAAERGTRVVAIGQGLPDDLPLGEWGADHVVALRTEVLLPPEEDVAAVVAAWCEQAQPWAVLVPGTVWGREVASRVAAALQAGLTGDAVGLAVEREPDRLLAWKPAFGGMVVAGITSSSPVQMATVRPGVLGHRPPRPAPAPLPLEELPMPARSRVRVVGRAREDDAEALATAEAIVGVGQGVDPDRYGELEPLLEALGAELAATRKVTDKGWMPRARQIGITGHSVSPRLYVAIGTSGKLNHTIGIRGAGTVLAIDTDPEAPLWEHADVGITADWAEAVPLLVDALRLTPSVRPDPPPEG